MADVIQAQICDWYISSIKSNLQSDDKAINQQINKTRYNRTTTKIRNSAIQQDQYLPEWLKRKN